MKLKRLCISCGGTGGHFYPGLAVGRRFQEQGGEVLLLLGGKHADKQAATAASFGIRSVKIAASLPSLSPIRFIRFALSVLKGTWQCRKAYKQFRPDALLAMGSYASFPPILGSRWCHVPLFLHDGNARLGKTNLRMGPLAKALALSFPTPDSAKCGCPTVLTGMPLRPELVQNIPDKAEAIRKINERWQVNFQPDYPTLLVFGGSLGAASINTFCRVPLDTPENAVQLIHLTGPEKLSETEEYYRNAKFPHLLLDASPEMALFYAAADWVICRAGGSTVSEVACFGKFSTLIPYPFAAQDHQTDNAHYLTASEGAELVPDSQLSAESFRQRLQTFLADPEAFRERGKRVLPLAFPDAADRVIRMIDSFLLVP